MLDRRTAAAIGHPVRVAILHEFEERDLVSPSEVARTLGLPVTAVAYHFRRLTDLGFLKLGKRVPRRGAMEHYYKLRQPEESHVVRPWLEPDQTPPELSVVLDEVAVGDLAASVHDLYARMRQLELATVTRAGAERGGRAFAVHVGFDMQPLPASAPETDSRR